VTARLPDILDVRPFTHPVRGEAVLPGSKSLTNRALLLAALCDQTVTLTGALFSDDTRIMAEALRQLGFAVVEDAAAQTIRVEGRGGKIPAEEAELFVGLAGTAARFLTALCAAAPRGVYRLDGVPQMRKRPMKGLLEALRSLGARIRCLGEEDCFPLEIGTKDGSSGGGLRGGWVDIDASESSQMLSALMMAAPLARSDVRIARARPVREPFVKMTAELMRRFGVPSAVADGAPGLLQIPKGSYHLSGTAKTGGPAASFPIEPDATAASYFLALPLVAGGRIGLPGLGSPSLQGDLAFGPVLERAGLSLSAGPSGLVARFDGGERRGVTQDFAAFSDTFLTLAAIAPLLRGPTTITGIAHTRKQETDRVSGMARELRENLGQEVKETDDALTITPRPLPSGRTIDTHGDHRFAMSFAILGCHNLHGDGRPWLSIRDPGCAAKTFPHFFEALENIRMNSSVP